MITDNNILVEFPFSGTFYQLKTDKGQGLLNQQTIEEVVLDVECDIQTTNHSNGSGVLASTHAVFFSRNGIEEPFPVKKGMMFRGTLYGYEIKGKVLSVELSMLNACCCYIRDLDE